jgi:hypothetical protein
LSTYRIGLAQPSSELDINILRHGQAKVMYLIPLGDRVNPTKTGVRHASGQDQMPVEPAPARRDLGKRHPHLEGDSRLLRQDRDPATLLDRMAKCFEECPNGGVLPTKVVFQVVATARVGLIAVREPPAAPGTGPKWTKLTCSQLGSPGSRRSTKRLFDASAYPSRASAAALAAFTSCLKLAL